MPVVRKVFPLEILLSTLIRDELTEPPLLPDSPTPVVAHIYSRADSVQSASILTVQAYAPVVASVAPYLPSGNASVEGTRK